MKRIIAIVLIMIVLFSQLTERYAQAQNESQETSSNNDSSPKVILNARNAILYDKTYHTVLFEKNAHERVPNASTTKMLTAIIAYENAKMDEMVTISKNAANTRGSVIGLKSGDQITLDSLMKGLLVRSGNDTAVAIAEYIGGDVEGFERLLNQKAEEMGLQNTHFVTPHGLDAENHYSSAYDLVKIAEYLLDIPYLSQIVKQQTVTIMINQQPQVITTTNEMFSSFEGVDGVKTGYTANAGRCLVTSCTKEGRTLISVVLGCGTKGQRTSDSKQLLNYGFQEFRIIDICQDMQKDFMIFIKKSKKKQYQISIEKSLYFPIKKGLEDRIRYEYRIPSVLEAPIIEKTLLGNIYIYLDEKVLCELEIKFPYHIPSKSVLDYVEEFMANYQNNIERAF